MDKASELIDDEQTVLNAEPSSEVSNQFSRLENFLNHKIAQNFLKYEFQYDDCEQDFFNKYETFDNQLSQRFPKLKTRNLTMVEWRKIRQMISMKKNRRFSVNFIKESRSSLAKYRQHFNSIQENGRSNLLPAIMTIEPNQEFWQKELYRCMIEMKQLLAAKQNAVIQLQNINSIKSETPNTDNCSDAIEVLKDIERFNERISKKFEKLWSFDSVKEALMLDAASKRIHSLRLSSHYFRLHCQLRAHDSLCQYGSVIGFEMLIELMKILLEMVSTVIDTDLLATDAVRFFDNSSDDHLRAFQSMLSKSNIEYVETVCLPIIFRLLKKLFDDPM